jgi:hypothetical protein
MRDHAQEERRLKIIDLTCRMVENQVSKGEVNPENDEELRRATKEAAKLAKAALDAAEEFVNG